MKWILYSNVGCWYLSGNDSTSNPSEKTQVSLSLYIYTYIYIYMREREIETLVVPEGFEPESFPLKYQHPTFKYKIHSVEVDLYYLKQLKIKNQVF